MSISSRKKEIKTPGPSSSIWLILILIQCNGVGRMTNSVKFPANAHCSRSICQFKGKYESGICKHVHRSQYLSWKRTVSVSAQLDKRDSWTPCCSGYSSYCLTSDQCYQITNHCFIFKFFIMTSFGSVFALFGKCVIQHYLLCILDVKQTMHNRAFTIPVSEILNIRVPSFLIIPWIRLLPMQTS